MRTPEQLNGDGECPVCNTPIAIPECARTPAPSPLEAAKSALMEIEADCLELSRLPLVGEDESRTWRAIRNKIIAVRSALSGPAKGGEKP